MTAIKHTDSHEVEHGPNRLSCKVSYFYHSTSPSCLSPVTWEQLLTQTHEQLATPSKLERDTSISLYSVRVNDNMRYDKVETKHTSILAFLPITLFHVPSIDALAHLQPGPAMLQLTEKGSACFQLMEDPHEAFRADSGSDSGITTTMNRRMNAEMMVAMTMTWVVPSS